MRVKRGPQFVQVTKGWRKRRFAGSVRSARQSSQIVTSGETNVRPGPCSDLRMVNEVPPAAGSSSTATPATSASTGASGPTRSQKAATSASRPSTSTTTPSAVFQTAPARSRERAST